MACIVHCLPNGGGEMQKRGSWGMKPGRSGMACGDKATDTTVVSLMEWATTKVAASSAARRLPGIAPQMRRAAAC